MKKFDASAFPFPLHSVAVFVDGKVLQDDYFAPCKKGEMHRMFSITKSFCSMATGALISEGKLSLSDRISSYFPEYVPDPADPRLTEMTIGDMLCMQTCHRATTYKVNMKENWVESFFITPPDHTPGTFFKYDTSSSHVLAALVKKLTGCGVLDYLRPVFLDAIGFSESAYILKDPFGSEMGGSGLICTPEDILKVSVFLLNLISGNMDVTRIPEAGDPVRTGHPSLQKSGSPADSSAATGPNPAENRKYGPSFFTRFSAYMREAVSCLVPTIGEGQTIDEQQGYGRMFWRLRPLSKDESAFMMYGMGGQYAVFYPERHAVFVTTADSQNIKGGQQYILDEIRSCALTLPRLESSCLLPVPDHESSFTVNDRMAENDGPSLKADARKEPSLRADAGKEPSLRADAEEHDPVCGSYKLVPNVSGFTALTLSEDELDLYEDGLPAPFVFSFSRDDAWGETVDPKYGQKLFSRKKLLFDGSLLIEVQILSDYAGSIRFLVKTDGDRIFLYSRKVEETYFNEFTGFFEGRRKK